MVLVKLKDDIDIKEQILRRKGVLLDILLLDRTTKKISSGRLILMRLLVKNLRTKNKFCRIW